MGKRNQDSVRLKSDLDPNRLNICNLCAIFMETVCDNYFLETAQGKVPATRADTDAYKEMQGLCLEWKQDTAPSEVGVAIVHGATLYASFVMQSDGINEQTLSAVPPSMLTSSFVDGLAAYGQDLKPLQEFCTQMILLNGPVVIQ